MRRAPSLAPRYTVGQNLEICLKTIIDMIVVETVLEYLI